MRKTALLTGVAGLLLMTAPAFAQDSTAPQTTPAPAPAEQPQSLQLSPGSNVIGSDGSTLGTLEGVRDGASGQELTVRGPDGALRGVPTSGGVEADPNGVKVGWSASQFSSAPAIEGGEATPAPTPAPAEPTTPPEASAPTTAEPAEPGDAAEPTPAPEPTPGETVPN
jgi:hypothetical protein